MAYVGNTPTTQSFISGTDYFNGDGATIAFTLSRAVVSVNDIEAVVNNVVQQPNTAYTISGTTITFTSAPSAGTSNIYVRYLSTTTQSITPSQNTVSYSTLNSDNQSKLGISFKNRIINGAMVIDQRNAGAAVTNPGSNVYIIDRWYTNTSFTGTIGQNLGSVTPPTGFKNYFGLSAGVGNGISNYAFRQVIEGYNIADLGWGTSDAKTVTLSFWVRSSLTGTFGGSVTNYDQNRSFVIGYTISTANTWEYKTFVVPGDTTGTWNTTNSGGIHIYISQGCASAKQGAAGSWTANDYRTVTGAVDLLTTTGATFYLTGVQLEVGTQATTFDYRSYGTELSLCQRYFYKNLNDTGSDKNLTVLQAYASTAALGKICQFPVTMRTTPTCTASGTFRALNSTGGAFNDFTVLTDISTGTKDYMGTGGWTGTSGLSAGNATYVAFINNSYVQASAEL